MKKDIHPKYYPKAKVKCACGAVFEIGSTKEFIEVEICSQCHPFFTGKEKIIETGQVERFRKRLAKKQGIQPKKKKKRKVQKSAKIIKSSSSPGKNNKKKTK